jgi:hypothetical protein
VNIASSNRIKLAQSTRINARRKLTFTVMVTAR